MTTKRRLWTQEEKDYLKEHLNEKDIKEIAADLGRTVNAIKSFVYKDSLLEFDRSDKEFAVYKGDKLIAMGTALECAKIMNVNPTYIQWLTSPVAQKRLATRKNPENATVGMLL